MNYDVEDVCVVLGLNLVPVLNEPLKLLVELLEALPLGVDLTDVGYLVEVVWQEVVQIGLLLAFALSVGYAFLSVKLENPVHR